MYTLEDVQSVDFELASTKSQWDFHEHCKQPHKIFWDVVLAENVYVLLGG